MFGLMMYPMTTNRTTLTCGKCNGTGRYFAGGHCYACNGRGSIRVTAAEAARIERAKASGNAHTDAVRTLRAGGLAAARAFVATHRDNVSALCAILGALQDEDFADESAALHAWIARRFPGAVAS